MAPDSSCGCATCECLTIQSSLVAVCANSVIHLDGIYLGQGQSSWSQVENVLFSYRCDCILRCDTLCGYTLWSVVFLIVCRVLFAKVVRATATKGFLVDILILVRPVLRYMNVCWVFCSTKLSWNCSVFGWMPKKRSLGELVQVLVTIHALHVRSQQCWSTCSKKFSRHM